MPLWSTPGSMTTENITEREALLLVVAVRAAAVPSGTSSLESPSTALTFPLPVLARVAWCCD